MKKAGKIETGTVFEQYVEIENPDGTGLRLRCIELQLDTPTESGDEHIRLLSNLPAEVSGQTIAALYRRRWSIENMFQRLQSVLHSENGSLAHPKAALLGFAVAVMAYNTLSVVLSAVDSKHGINENSDIELSSFYVANEIKIGYHGMLIAVEPSAFDALERLSTKKLALWLLEVSSHVDPKRFRKQVRGPKPKVKKTYVSSHEATKHVATARVLGKGSI